MPTKIKYEKKRWFDSIIAKLKSKGLKKTDIAKKLDITPQRLTNLLNGNDVISDKLIDDMIDKPDLGRIVFYTESKDDLSGLSQTSGKLRGGHQGVEKTPPLKECHIVPVNSSTKKIKSNKMKIEKKYRVDTEDYNITEVNGLIDDEGKLVAACELDDSDFYAPREYELYHDTKEAARQALASITPTEEEFKKVLRFLNNAPVEKIKEHDETIKTVIEDNSFIYKAIYGEQYEYISDNFTRFLSGSTVMRIRLLVQQRILNIDGISVSIDSVSHVKWGENDRACKLILKDGTEVFCSEKEGHDLWFVKLVFGNNESHRYFPNLHR